MKEKRNKAFKYRLAPNQAQRTLFAQFAGSARFVFNEALSRYKCALESNSKLPDCYDAINRLPSMKKSEETAWLKEAPSQVLQQALLHLYTGISTYYVKKKKNKKVGLPKFKKRGKKDSFTYPQGIKVNNRRVFLPKIGWVKYRDSRPVEGTIKQAVIKREGDYWYITFFTEVEMDITRVQVKEEEAVGIDAGLSNYITLSNGETIENPRLLKKYLKELARLQRELSRKVKFSSNWKKCAARIQLLHIRIKNLRNDFLHKLSTLLSKSHGVVCVENLNIKGMVKNRKLARSISDAGWGKFFTYLEYKCDWYGKHFVKVARMYPSSKLCSACGNKQDMPLNKRVYDCNSCGLVLDRDLNASINLRLAGMSILKTCGANDISLRREAGIHGF